MIASAMKPCQRNTLQGIGQSAGFWFKVSGSKRAQVLVLIEGPLEAEILNQKLETRD